jgi:hypothetical protein
MGSGTELRDSDNNNNNNCDCCEGIKKLTPVKIENFPGQSRLAYRVGTYSKFKESMFVRLSSNKALSWLTTRDATSDLAIALLDSSAVILDVLTLYQEMNANEGFLRTATERRSILELASEIGYKLRPGVAASTFLAFSLEENSLQPKQTVIDIGTKVQSLPGDSEMPLIFETTEKIEARAEWNNLKPELTTKQKIGSTSYIIYFQGVNTQLKPGDGILIVIKDADDPASIPTYTFFRIVSRVIVDTDRQTTLVEVSEEGISGVETVRDDNFKTSVYAFRIKAGIFGNSAPSYDVMPNSVTNVYQPWDAPPLPINKRRPTIYEANFGGMSEDVEYGKDGKLIYLDNSYSNIVPTSKSNESWIVLDSPDIADKSTIIICKVQETLEETLVDFASSTKVTGLVLDIDASKKLLAFTMRKTSVYAQSEELMLAEVPIGEPIKKENSILLSKEITSPSVGQLISITGETIDDSDKATGLTFSEILIVAEIGVDNGQTKLTFKDKLRNSYKRDTVILNANVARATHGQTKQLVLGGGDPSRYLQHFVLKEKPLTYITASTASGVKSTLDIRVDDILWKESESLYNLGARDRSYVTSIDNELQTHIFFGDGNRGLRPNAGLDNIKAKYRVGIGKEGGMLKAGQLNILMDMPLGVRGVTNPCAPDGAADPENIDRARQNAPLTVLTMDRLVSLTDYENFARAFRGIGKAHAIWIWDGQKRIVYLTITSEKGTTVAPDLYMKLVEAINNFKDPVTRFKIGYPELKTFRVIAEILISDGFAFEKVKLKVEETLKNKFSFEARQFGQPVRISEVVSIIQNVEGVEAAKIEYLYPTEDDMSRQNLIPSRVAHWDNIERKVVPAELIILDSPTTGGVGEGVTITEMRGSAITI